MAATAEIESWFAAKKPPAEVAMRRVREVILSADPRLREYMKYGSVHFGYEGDFVTFVQADKKNVNLMFHRGARIPGKFPHLEGPSRPPDSCVSPTSTRLKRVQASCNGWRLPGARSWHREPRRSSPGRRARGEAASTPVGGGPPLVAVMLHACASAPGTSRWASGSTRWSTR